MIVSCQCLTNRPVSCDRYPRTRISIITCSFQTASTPIQLITYDTQHLLPLTIPKHQRQCTGSSPSPQSLPPQASAPLSPEEPQSTVCSAAKTRSARPTRSNVSAPAVAPTAKAVKRPPLIQQQLKPIAEVSVKWEKHLVKSQNNYAFEAIAWYHYPQQCSAPSWISTMRGGGLDRPHPVPTELARRSINEEPRDQDSLSS
jgi:hypothetical protein